MENNLDYKNIIIAHHKHGLGASDGDLLYKISGLGCVPSSCTERLAIIKGLYEKPEDITTMAMQKGNDLELSVFEMLHNEDERWESNKYIESKKFSRENCKLFCHIDFFLQDNEKKTVTFVECKCTNKSLIEARRTYTNQLFLENVLGKEYTEALGSGWKFSMKLCHYQSSDYEGVLNPEKIELKSIRFGRGEFNVGTTMDIVSNYLSEMTEFYKDEIDANYLPEKVKNEVETISNYLTSIKEMNDKVDEFKKKMYDFMVQKNIKSIKNDSFLITRVDESIVPRFDSKKFELEHRTTYKKYIKNTVRKGYALFKVKGEKDNG